MEYAILYHNNETERYGGMCVKKKGSVAAAVIYLLAMCVFIGFVAMMLRFLIDGLTGGLDPLLRTFYAFALGALALAVATVIVVLILEHYRMSTISGIRFREGYSERYYTILRKKLALRKRRKTSALGNTVFYASELANGRHYDEAFAELEKISPETLSDEELAYYFNALIYFSLLCGNTEQAERYYAVSADCLERYKHKKATGGAILRTLAVLEYARGNFTAAESQLSYVKYNAKSRGIQITCDLYLGLIYLHTGRREHAKHAALEALPQVTTPRQKEDLAKLMKLVERAYSLA